MLCWPIGGSMSEQIRFEGENKDIAKLVTKLVDVLKNCKAVKKSGMNTAQKYQYATEADILEVVRDQLVKNKIFVFSSSNTKEVITMEKLYKGEKQGENVLAVVNGEHAFTCGETGARVVVGSTGTGWDMTDKGVFKAITGLNKYMFSKNFMIESEDDPERDNANPSYTKTGNTGGTKTSAPAEVTGAKTFGAPKVKAPTVKKAEKKVEEKVPSQPKAVQKPVFGKRILNKDNSEPAF
jgi:hypothetical protein